MVPNLPPILPTRPNSTLGSSVSGSGPARAQNFSTTRLNYQKDRADSKVSINQAIRAKAAANRTGSSTSVSRVNQTNSPAVTSINRRAGDSREEQMTHDKGADDRRYAYARAKIKARKNKEVAEKLIVHTGTAFNKQKFEKQLDVAMKADPKKYGHMAKKDKKIFAGMVGGVAKAKATGTRLASYDKENLKKVVETVRRSGAIGDNRSREFKKVIGTI